jgi:hypothetical protein
MSHPWDYDKIKARANARARERFGQAASTRFKSQNAPADLIRKPAVRNGIGLRTLEKMAELLEWTVPELMGVSPAPGPAHVDRVRSLVARVFEDRLTPGDWRVEREYADGRIEVAIFSGPNARERAIRYADHQYSDFEKLSLAPPHPRRAE